MWACTRQHAARPQATCSLALTSEWWRLAHLELRPEHVPPWNAQGGVLVHLLCTCRVPQCISRKHNEDTTNARAARHVFERVKHKCLYSVIVHLPLQSPRQLASVESEQLLQQQMRNCWSGIGIRTGLNHTVGYVEASGLLKSNSGKWLPVHAVFQQQHTSTTSPGVSATVHSTGSPLWRSLCVRMLLVKEHVPMPTPACWTRDDVRADAIVFSRELLPVPGRPKSMMPDAALPPTWVRMPSTCSIRRQLSLVFHTCQHGLCQLLCHIATSCQMWMASTLH